MFAYTVMTNDELFNIYDCGIEGVHYEVDENGYYVSLNDPDNPGFSQGALGLTNYIFNEDAKIYSESYQWVLDYYEESIEPYIIENVFQNFPEDYSSYSDLQTANSESPNSTSGRSSAARWKTRKRPWTTPWPARTRPAVRRLSPTSRSSSRPTSRASASPMANRPNRQATDSSILPIVS